MQTKVKSCAWGPAAREDGPAAILADGREARLVPVGDQDRFVQEVCRLLQDRDSARRLATAGQD